MPGWPPRPPDFEQLHYETPEAPKGGRPNLAYRGACDSLNPYTGKALSTAQGLIGNVYQSLMTRSADEPFTLYGLLAQSVETDDARTYVTFGINPAARFADGKPVTPADVIFSWELLRDKGRPNYRTYYIKVAKVEIVGERVVRFD